MKAIKWVGIPPWPQKEIIKKITIMEKETTIVKKSQSKYLGLLGRKIMFTNKISEPFYVHSLSTLNVNEKLVICINHDASLCITQDELKNIKIIE